MTPYLPTTTIVRFPGRYLELIIWRQICRRPCICGYLVSNVVRDQRCNVRVTKYRTIESISIRHRLNVKVSDGLTKLWPRCLVYVFMCVCGCVYVYVYVCWNNIRWQHAQQNKVRPMPKRVDVLWLHDVTRGAKSDLHTWTRAPSQYKDRLIYVWRFPC